MTFTQVMYPPAPFIPNVLLNQEEDVAPQLGRNAVTAAANRLREPAIFHIGDCAFCVIMLLRMEDKSDPMFLSSGLKACNSVRCTSRWGAAIGVVSARLCLLTNALHESMMTACAKYVTGPLTGLH